MAKRFGDLRLKHPKCKTCGGCLDHSECRIVKKGGCTCPKGGR